LGFPTIEIDSPEAFFRVEGLTFKIADILPDQLNIQTDSNIKFDFEKQKRTGYLGLKVNVGPFKTKIEKVHFHVRKYTGIKYKDYGVIDIKVKNASLEIDLILKLEAETVDHIEVRGVHTSIDYLKIKVRESKHKILDRMATNLFIGAIKHKLCKTVDEKLYNALQHGMCDRINESLKMIRPGRRRHKD